MNKTRLFLVSICFFVIAVHLTEVEAFASESETKEPIIHSESDIGTTAIPHTWEKISSDFKMVHAGTHEYSVWHNFIKKTRKCDITHRIRTEVWYCDFHGHTKSEVSLEETIHSYQHSD